MQVSFDAATPYRPKLDAPSISAGFNAPFGFPMLIVTAAQRIEVGEGAVIEAPEGPAEGGSEDGSVRVGVVNGTMAARAGEEGKFAELLRRITLEEVVEERVRVSARVKIATGVGEVVIDEIKVEDTLRIPGLNGLKTTTINSLQITSGTPAGIGFSIGTTITNPSRLKLANLGLVAFTLMYDGQDVGTITIPDFNLREDENNITATAFYSPQTPDAVRAGTELLSRYISGETSDVTIHDCTMTPPISSLIPALSSLTITTTLPPSPYALIESTHLYIGVLGAGSTATLTLHNPFPTPLTLTAVTSTISALGNVIATATHTFNPALVVQAGQTATSEAIGVQLVVGLDLIGALIGAAGAGGARVDVDGKVDTTVGAFEVKGLGVKQKGVLAVVTMPGL
ncbi:hypothetical protein HK104_000662 [Borealophlyctis nickersoniae]|nr:hypothetical protein HK104_000662 [Borealophlyctis nickersoniae]